MRGIAQSGSALPLGGRGRRFESYYPDQIIAVEWNGYINHARLITSAIPGSTPGTATDNDDRSCSLSDLKQFGDFELTVQKLGYFYNGWTNK